MLWISLSILVFLGILLTIVGKSVNKKEKEKQERIINKQHEVHNFNPTQNYYTNGKIISIDENTSRLVITEEHNNHIVKFSDIIESELIENESSVTKTSRSSQLGGALVGGVIAGGIGAVVGGLSGTKRSETAVNKITLKIVADDLRVPNLYIDFLNSTIALKHDHPMLIEARNNANHWHGIVSVIIRRQGSIVS